MVHSITVRVGRPIGLDEASLANTDTDICQTMRRARYCALDSTLAILSRCWVVMPSVLPWHWLRRWRRAGEHRGGIKILADEKIDYLVGLAKLLLPIDPAAARYCFDAAMSAAGDVDYDTLHALSVTTKILT